MSNVILVSSGDLLDLENPDIDNIYIEDIAQALSRIPRFCGHTHEFYSVAQHCCLVVEILEDMGSIYLLEGLLHEITEAYGLGDVSTPMKKMLGTKAMEVINQFEEKLSEAFDLTHPFPEDIHKADKIALATEFYQLFGREGREVVQKFFGHVPLFSIDISPLPPAEAEELFLDYFDTIIEKENK